MIRKTTTLGLLVLLVVLAGCTGGGDGTDGAGATTTVAPAGEPSSSGEGVSLVDDRTAALRSAGSYTAVWTMAFETDGESVGETTYTHAVDFENERSSFSMLMAGEEGVASDFESYHADGVSYVRYGSGEEATYSVNADATFAPEDTLFPVEGNVLDDEDLAGFSAVGTETFDGVTVTRYERTDRPTWVAAQGTDGEFRWTSFTYAVLVDGDGFVRSESWSGEGVDEDGVAQSITFSYSLTGVGSTTVEAPDWVGEAREQAGQ